jgi:hypothetical protein
MPWPRPVLVLAEKQIFIEADNWSRVVVLGFRCFKNSSIPCSTLRSLFRRHVPQFPADGASVKKTDGYFEALFMSRTGLRVVRCLESIALELGLRASLPLSAKSF